MFLDFLLSQHHISELQYNKVLAELDTQFKGNLTQALLSVGVSEELITKVKSDFYKIPYQKISAGTVPFEVLKYISEESARNYHFVPIAFTDEVLSVGITEPENIEAMNALQFISVKQNIPFKIFLISQSDFLRVVERYKSVSSQTDVVVSELNEELQNELQQTAKELKKDLTASGQKQELGNNKIVEDAPIIKIVSVIINNAIEGDASDIHIEHTGEKVRVRYRVDGTLHTTLVLPIQSFDGIVARIKILAKLRLDEKRKPQDGSFATLFNERKIEFRVSTFPAYYGEKIVMRILDSEKGVKGLDDLDLSPENLALLKYAITRPYGLILISGPTGSGKSTTLYSLLNEVDKEGSNVLSLEDPVEYQIPGVTQSQVMPEIGYTFASGLRSILRQDPNIIMVGEIRDKETAQLAIQAALTGHLVLSTIHTNSAIGIVPRLVDMGVDPYLIAPTLILGMAQRLVRKVHQNARKKIPLDQVTKELISKQFANYPKEYLEKIHLPDYMHTVVTTPEAPSGFQGRLAVFEMFAVDSDIQSLILKNPVESELYKTCRAKGMLTLREDALLKALEGKCSLQEVYSFN